MSVLEWKKFNLFALVPSADSNKLQNIKSKITAHCYNANEKVFCDSLGCVHVFFRSWAASLSFEAHETAILLCAITKKKSLLVTLSNHREEQYGIFLKVFDLQKISKRNTTSAMSFARLKTLNEPSVMKTFSIENQLCIAIGFESGDIILHRSSISKDMSSNFNSYTISKRKITGIEFWENPVGSLFMFLCSDTGVFCYTFCDKDIFLEKKILFDITSVPTRCSSIRTGEFGEPYFIVGRDDAVYFFTKEGRGPCFAIEGEKLCITEFGDNLIIALSSYNSQIPQTHLYVIDIKNKMIVLNKILEDITCIQVENDNCFIITTSNKVFSLREHKLQTKLRLLLSKNLYDIALRVLETSDVGCQEKGQLYMKYGDYLLFKGDYNEAVKKYINTIGIIDPYCVIQKLLDSRNTRFLIQYLQALIQTEFATEEHKELFLKGSKRLDLSLKYGHLCIKNDMENKSSNTDLGANIECKIISDCKLSTCLKFIQNQKQIIQFFCQFDENQIYSFMTKNSQLLMTNYPREIINIIKELSDHNSSTKYLIRRPERFIPMLITNTDYCIEFLEHILTGNIIKHNKTLYHFLLELYLQEWKKKKIHINILMDFLKRYENHLCKENVFLMCKNYSFWKGISYIHKSEGQNRLLLQYIINSCDLQDKMKHSEYFSPHMLIQAINKEQFKLENSAQLVSCFLNIMLGKKHQSILQSLQSISKNENLFVFHIKEVFIQEHKKKVSEFKNQTDVVHMLFKQSNILNSLLQNYILCPIEFRSSVCDICKQQLNLPAVYYLCQHSFHKECVSTYLENKTCSLCSEIKKKFIHKEFITNTGQSFNNVTTYKHVVNLISLFIGYYCIFSVKNKANIINSTGPNRVQFVLENSNQWQGRFNNFELKPEKSTNPFEDELVPDDVKPIKQYDANLNPFEE